MTTEKPQDDFYACTEYPVEIRNAIAESADNLNPTKKEKKASEKEAESS